MACRIEQSPDSNHRVCSESTHIAQPVANLALQKVVGDGDWIIQVGEEIGDRATYGGRRDLDVSACDRTKHCVIDRAVERIHRSIDALEAIAGIRLPGGQCSAAAERQYHCERREHMEGVEFHITSEQSDQYRASITVRTDRRLACSS